MLALKELANNLTWEHMLIATVYFTQLYNSYTSFPPPGASIVLSM